jgi:hypothetical protein
MSPPDHHAQVPLPPSGNEYMFGSTQLTITGATGLSVEFPPGVVLRFDVGGGVGLEGCSGVTIDGATIDYMPTLAQGRVVATMLGTSEPSVVADFDPAFLRPDGTVTPFFNTSSSIKVSRGGDEGWWW